MKKAQNLNTKPPRVDIVIEPTGIGNQHAIYFVFESKERNAVYTGTLEQCETTLANLSKRKK